MPDFADTIRDPVAAGFATGILDNFILVFVEQHSLLAAVVWVRPRHHYRIQGDAAREDGRADVGDIVRDGDVREADAVSEGSASEVHFGVRKTDACQAGTPCKRSIANVGD